MAITRLNTNSLGTVKEGITVAEQWRLTSNKTSDGDINANLSLSNYNGIGNVNAGMTQSSGVFTFPSTGIWFIQFNAVLEEGSQSSNDGLTRFRILTTTDNSTYNPVAVAQEGVAGTLFAEFSGHSSVNVIFDVVSTTTHKCKFDVASLTTGNRLVGNANGIYTNFTFIRLGDT